MSHNERMHLVENNYPLQVYQAYNNNPQASKAVAKIATCLTDLYRYFEPAFFNGKFLVAKKFDDTYCFPKEGSIDLYDKAILLQKTTGNIFVQVFENDNIVMWDNVDHSALLNDTSTLIYLFEGNREFFLANSTTIEITDAPKGSRYATQFVDLMRYLTTYSTERVRHSSCPIFKKSWFDTNRLFFRSEGSGNNIPEDHIQESLFEYLRTSLRGISMETSREFNLSTSTAKPKPVDLKIQWKEANRTALIEVKWGGQVKSIKTGKTRNDDVNKRANEGYVQLKGYYDSALSDMPNSIIKAHLVVIDGRRNNLKKNDTAISHDNGMFYADKDIVIDASNKYHDAMPSFEKPIRMFAAPITQ